MESSGVFEDIRKVRVICPKKFCPTGQCSRKKTTLHFLLKIVQFNSESHKMNENIPPFINPVHVLARMTL